MGDMRGMGEMRDMATWATWRGRQSGKKKSSRTQKEPSIAGFRSRDPWVMSPMR